MQVRNAAFICIYVLRQLIGRVFYKFKKSVRSIHKMESILSCFAVWIHHADHLSQDLVMLDSLTHMHHAWITTRTFSFLPKVSVAIRK